MNRFGAFAVHLGISLIIFAVLGYMILFHWYPDFFFVSDGGWQGIRIVAFVDFVLGPTLTLVVFNRAKPRKELRRDLSIIGLIQIASLTAGVWVVFSERPIALVFSDGSFQSLAADDFRAANREPPDLSGFPGPSPKWLAVVLPEDYEAQAEIRLRSIQTGTPLRVQYEFFQPVDPEFILADTPGLSREELERRDARTPFLERFLEGNGGRMEDYVFVPFATRYSIDLLAIHRVNQNFIHIGLPLPGSPEGGRENEGESGAAE